MSERGAARQRTERRLRSWAKHERLSVAMALAEALHHSSGLPTKTVVERRERREGEVREEHIAPRGQTRPPPGMRPAPLVEVAEPQVVEAARAHRAAGVPSLAPAVLGGGGDGVDSAALAFLSRTSCGRRRRRR